MEENVITEYILKCPANTHNHLWTVYNTLEAVLGTNTRKTFAYQMPTYKAKRNVIHFAATKNHIGIYPGPEAIANYKHLFDCYQFSKGSLQIKYNQKVPVELIKQLAIYSYQLNK